MGPIGQLIIGFTIQVIGNLLQARQAAKSVHKPKKSQFKEPTAEPGRTITIIAGTVLIEDPQILYVGEKDIGRRKISMKAK